MYSALEDLKGILVHEVGILESVDDAEARVLGLIDSFSAELAFFPARNQERSYGFANTLRRSCSLGKCTCFYRVDEGGLSVRIDKIAASKADFNRFHFS